MRPNKITKIIVVSIFAVGLYFVRDLIELAERQSLINPKLFVSVIGLFFLNYMYFLFFFIFEPEKKHKIIKSMFVNIPFIALGGYWLCIYGFLSIKPIQKIFLLVSENVIGNVILHAVVGIIALFVFGFSIYVINELDEILNTPSRKTN